MVEYPGQDFAAEGIAAFKSGDARKAVPLLRQAVEEAPTRFDLRMYLGLAMAKLDKWADAEMQFEKATTIDGSSADAYYYLGVAIAKQGRLYEAHNTFKVALGNNPNHAGAQAAAQKTAHAASQVTTSGSSAVMPGGIGPIDLSGDLEMGPTGMSSGGTSSAAAGTTTDRPADPMQDALAELQQQEQSGGTVKRGKGGGCLTSLLALVGLLSMAVWLVSGAVIR